ncbi:hypothetical protein N431DRAFT_432782 [Stipitochalara longipes BDJ]|nr:hypothetical protein N431DRAFT_432782 [Stipitochalara longipes BDJ]
MKKRLCSSLDETKSLAKQITQCKTEPEGHIEVSYEKEDVTLHNLTRFFCLMSEKRQAILKQRVEMAERKAVEEKERHRKFHATVQKDVRDLIKRTGGIGSSTQEVLEKSAVDEFKESSG